MTAPSQILPRTCRQRSGRSERSPRTRVLHRCISIMWCFQFWGEKRNLIEARITNGTIKVGDQISISQEITDCSELKNRYTRLDKNIRRSRR